MILSGPVARSGTALAFAAITTFSAACSKDRLKAALSATPPAAIDYEWVRDSTIMAEAPTILFRAIPTASGGTQAVPIGTIGAKGFEPLRMGNRGWHFFDLTYLHEGSSLHAIRDGRSAGDVALIRGHWESGKPTLDSIPGCQVAVPGGLIAAPTGVHLLVSGNRPQSQGTSSLSGGELQEAIDRAFKLVVPSAGVSLALQSRYTQEVRQVSTGVGPKPTILIILDDPEVVADDVPGEGQRPRHVVLLLDNARFGYKVTYQYTTLGNRKSNPRYEWLDHMDVDNDGRAELLFGLSNERFKKQAPTYTIGLHYKNDVWTQSFVYNLTRCQG